MKPERGKIQAERIVTMIRLFSVRHYGLTIEELVEEFGVSKRTIYRDLNLLDKIFPIEKLETAERTTYRIPPNLRIPLPAFDLPELMALRLSKNQLRYLKGTPFHKDFNSIFKKIESILPAKFFNHLDHFAHTIFVHPESPKDYHGMDKEISILQESLRRCKACKFIYVSRSRTSPKEYDVHPYGLVSFKRGLYLLAFVPEYKEIRCFALDSRVKGVQLTDSDYQIPEDFTIESYTQSAFGIVTGPPEEVEIEFDREVAANVSERIWHQSQKIEKKKDGVVTIKMKVAPSPEVTSWVLSYGPHARVRKPKWLLDDVKAELSEALKKYK
ncbi:MAG: WYL domain-containing protein [Proteobacteria bacterium]|nr:WYL domain-containing protein [Pseudomonadota bacterium]